MKQWKKIVCIAAAMLVICAAIVFLSGNRKECCLCNNPNYSVPCLVDLEAGDILELNLDGPSATYDYNGQSDVETFSFIRFVISRFKVITALSPSSISRLTNSTPAAPWFSAVNG